MANDIRRAIENRRPFIEYSDGRRIVYQSVSTRERLEQYSEEELRLFFHNTLHVTAYRQDCMPSATMLDIPIEVVPGSGEPPLYLHRGLLCRFSRYFERALQGPFREATENRVVMDDTTYDDLVLFAHWLYFRALRDPATEALLGLRQLFRLWIFADVRMVPDLQKHVTSELVAFDYHAFRRGSSYDDFKEQCEFVYDNTHDGSKLRLVLVAAWSQVWRDAHMNMDVELNRDLPQPLLLDLVAILRLGTLPPWVTFND